MSITTPLETGATGPQEQGEAGEPAKESPSVGSPRVPGLDSGGPEPPEGLPDEDAGAEDPAAPDPDTLGPGEERSDEELLQETLVLLFASPEPLSEGRLRVLLERPAAPRVKAVLDRLEERLRSADLPLVLRKIAGGWRLHTDPLQGEAVVRLRKEAKPERISIAALETLAIVAYRQPVTKAEIEAIRGVQAGPILRTLVDRGLVRVTGRADLPGNPLLYATTKGFLERFGLASLKDLPRDGELAGQ